MPSEEEKRHFATSIVETLRVSGYEAYFAGGCVRDSLLQQPSIDFDIATNATPTEVQALFRRTLSIGASFGVIAVQGSKGLAVEVATFRSDGPYTDGRRPDRIAFSTPQEDAARRDFTINGMFLNPITGKIIDFVGGEADLRQGIIRAIGDPNARIAEDKLRMLRAVRFAARFGFTIDADTMLAIQANASQLVQVSPERILAELHKMLTPPTRDEAVSLLRESGLLEVALPGLSPKNEADWAHTLEIVGYWRQDVPFPIAMASLYATWPGEAAADHASKTLRRLRGSNEDRDGTCWILANAPTLDQAPTLRPSILKRLLAKPEAPMLLDWHEARILGCDPTLEEAHRFARAMREQWLETGELWPPPLITGEDLKQLGRTPGPEFQQILNRVRDAQLDGTVRTREEALALLVSNEEPTG